LFKFTVKKILKLKVFARAGLMEINTWHKHNFYPGGSMGQGNVGENGR